MTKTLGASAQVRAVVDALVTAGLVDASRHSDAATVVTGVLSAPEARRTTSRGLLVEIAGYVGGALVLASAALFVAQQWDNLSDTMQVVVLAAIALLLGAAAAVVAVVGGGAAEVRAGADDVRRRLVVALSTAGALAAAVTVGRVVELATRTDQGNGSWPIVAGSATMFALSAALYWLLPSLLGQLAMIAAVFMGITSTWSLVDEMQTSTTGPGLTFLAIGLLWVLAAEWGVWRETTAARALGAGLTLFGAQFVRFGDDHNNLAYLLMLLVTVAVFAMYLRTASWPYLVVGVLGITLVVPEAIIDWTEGSLGAAGGVLVAGLTLLAAALVGLRVRKEVTEDAAERETEPLSR